MPAYHLAQINIGRLAAPVDDPRIASFIQQLEPVNRLADHSPGFVWRLQSSSGNATDIAYNDDPLMIVNMSVWESLEALRDFTYAHSHLAVFRQRRDWFVRLDLPHYCLWWVLSVHIPSVAEGRERLIHYQKQGSTPFSFWFTKPYPEPCDELALV